MDNGGATRPCAPTSTWSRIIVPSCGRTFGIRWSICGPWPGPLKSGLYFVLRPAASPAATVCTSEVVGKGLWRPPFAQALDVNWGNGQPSSAEFVEHDAVRACGKTLKQLGPRVIAGPSPWALVDTMSLF